jgi:hypothetical protein
MINYPLMKPSPSPIIDDVRPEYEFDYSKAVRGKYVKWLLVEGANVIVLAFSAKHPTSDND